MSEQSKVLFLKFLAYLQKKKRLKDFSENKNKFREKKKNQKSLILNFPIF